MAEFEEDQWKEHAIDLIELALKDAVRMIRQLDVVEHISLNVIAITGKSHYQNRLEMTSPHTSQVFEDPDDDEEDD